MHHSRDGFCFERLDDGSVRLRVIKPVVGALGATMGDAIVEQTVLPANEWASVIASVSANGESGVKHAHALDFHGSELHGSDSV